MLAIFCYAKKAITCYHQIDTFCSNKVVKQKGGHWYVCPLGMHCMYSGTGGVPKGTSLVEVSDAE